MHNNTTQQYLDIPVHKQRTISGHTPDTEHRTQNKRNNNMQHTICTQYAHTQKTDTEHTKTNNMHHIQDNIEQHTEQRTEQTQYPDTEQTQPQHRCITYDLHKYSFDFIVYDNISKNSIIQLYTNYIQTIYILLALLMR